MNPFNDINKFDVLIDSLEKDLQYSKNKNKDTKNLNAIINFRNSFDSMINNRYYTDAVEILIYHRLLYLYKEFNIANGGDINGSEWMLMFDFKTIFSLGLEYSKDNVVDELRKYLDFHALKDGTITEDSDKLGLYLKVQDKQIEEKLKERIDTIKSLIHYKLK